MYKILTEIQINSSPEKVWNALTDFSAYPNWNPFIKSISGKQAIGERLKVVVQPPNASSMSFTPKIMQFDEHAELRWKGKFIVKGIFDGEHFFRLKDNNDGTTTFIHGEHFSGLLVRPMKRSLIGTKYGFELMNSAIKKLCESLPPSH